MVCSLCFKKGKFRNLNPPEVDILTKSEKFSDMPLEDIMAFYLKFRSISKGQPYLDRTQFIEILNSFNIFPNDQVARRMFDIIDFNNKDQIEFIEFMHYIFLLVDGSKEEKARYIFKMIARKTNEEFDLEDLMGFYKMIDYRDDLNNSMMSFIEEKQEIEYEEMAKAVFIVMNKKTSEQIKFTEFKTKLIEQPEMLDLFNFLNADLDLSSQGLRIKKTYIDMMKILKQLQQDIKLLKNILFETPIEERIGSFSYGKLDKFNKTIMSLNKNQIKKSPSDNIKSNLVATAIINNRRIKNEINDVSLNINLEKIPSHNSSIKSESNESSVKSPKAQLYQTGLPKLNVEKFRLKSIVSSLTTKIKNITNILETEIKTTQSKNKFNYDLKRQMASHKLKDNKKVVFIDNPNWNIVTSLVSGIQKSISIVECDKYKSLFEHDFKFKNTIELQAINSVTFDKCKFKDYAPYIFQSIRRQYGISNDAYIKSIGVNTFRSAFFEKLDLMLTENSSGKSGSFFFHTSDGKYMIKTIKEKEFNVLRKTLAHYYEHILANPNTLLTRYYGLHKLKCYKKNETLFNIHIVVMNNIFAIKDEDLIEEKYDIKGSTYKRTTSEHEITKGSAKKDLNLINDNRKIRILHGAKQFIINQISKDAEFLAKHNIIDYSLLLGIMSKGEDENFRRISFLNSEKNYAKNSILRKGSIIDSHDAKYTYFIGIIDTLTIYDYKKKSEYVTKRIFQGKNISCIPPVNYKNRFVKFIENCIDSTETNS